MVLRQRESNKMSSEQPLKKKLRRGDDCDNSESPTDETDFIVSNLSDTHDLSSLHLALPPNVNEDDITLNNVNNHFSKIYDSTNDSKQNDATQQIHTITTQQLNSINSENSIKLAPPDIIASTLSNEYKNERHFIVEVSSHCCEKENDTSAGNDGLDDFQRHLIKQCLCSVSEATLRRPFEQMTVDGVTLRTVTLSEWPTEVMLQFLSNLHLLFDVYLKQNNKGFICQRVVSICDTILRNEYNIIEQIIALCENGDKYVNFMAARVLSSFLIVAKTEINNEWLETIMNYLIVENIDYAKMNFALEIVKRVVEWKDVEIHVLEDENESSAPSSSTINCEQMPCDPESYDTSGIKGLIIKSLESKWPELISRVQNLILNNNTSVQAQTCILTFLTLWESTISVKANLSIIDTKPFYAHLEIFVDLLNSNLPPIIWKQLLSLFNEVLCYGSTLALQDMLPDDACQLAHLIVRYVKDYRLLDSLPYRRGEGFTVNSFVGTILSTQPGHSNIDKTLMQKMVLLVLKSVAITIKETRSDSSDSSVGSEDYDFYQDMQLIERSIRDVLKKVDVFLKNSLDFHPETSFSKILIHLFNDQDDYMIEAMVCTLDITVGISYRNAVFPDLLNMLNPIHSFIEFLKIVNHDSDVLLDFLVSNETCFLLYLLRFLKYIRKNWSNFVRSCSESSSSSRGNELDNTMSVLIRLMMQIKRLVSKNLFPYNISPVLRLLDNCETLYEGNECS